MSQIYLPPAEWYESLPTVHVSACMLPTDDADRILLVKPNYRDYWAVPGEMADEGEPPLRARDRRGTRPADSIWCVARGRLGAPDG
ncbi:NUDIX hydrolase [Sphaerisporangium rhizosphaerae]|uniref:NUDIX hydrolase n=1 Tax=Sphaerisporangium rhizosphaerae TaxID=2269375 RepID=A0ABW2NZN0_9ACTN